MSNNNLSQNINISGSSLSGSQFGQAGRDQSQFQEIGQSSTSQSLNQKEVIDLLEDLEKILRGCDLSIDQREKALRYLSAAQEEAKAEEPDKRFAADSLKKVTKVLTDANETIEASQGVWDKIQPVLGKLVPWLGVAMGFFR